MLENMRSRRARTWTDAEVRKVLGSFLFSGDDVDKPAGVLSGGEKTRLALATLVVSSANVLLLDEPTNNLDPASREEILGALRTYTGAVVLVTHDEGAVEALQPERIILLPDGVEDLWGEDYARPGRPRLTAKSVDRRPTALRYSTGQPSLRQLVRSPAMRAALVSLPKAVVSPPRGHEYGCAHSTWESWRMSTPVRRA